MEKVPVISDHLRDSRQRVIDPCGNHEPLVILQRLSDHLLQEETIPIKWFTRVRYVTEHEQGGVWRLETAFCEVAQRSQTLLLPCLTPSE